MGSLKSAGRLQMLNSQLSDSIATCRKSLQVQYLLHCRGFWDKMGQIILKFLEGRKENRVWYSGSYHALGVLMTYLLPKCKDCMKR
ncbi:hypothetical protein HAX54_017433 [Datura stramonium]|uniref:Uncharacterized protein n=1 Tax=Datura stramonium TaxID=4076 RepID=A0ABS8UN02_DATST|nr:hypothetical protein [Datura stramonium]